MSKLNEKRIEVTNPYPVKKDEIIDLVERSLRLIHTTTDSKTIQIYIYNKEDRPEFLAEVEITSAGYVLHGDEGYYYQGSSFKEFQNDLREIVFHWDAVVSKRLKEAHYVAKIYNYDDSWDEYYIDEDGEPVDYLDKAKVFDNEQDAEDWAEENRLYNWGAYASKLSESKKRLKELSTKTEDEYYGGKRADTFESKTEPTQRINQMKKDGKLSKNAKLTIMKEYVSNQTTNTFMRHGVEKYFHEYIIVVDDDWYTPCEFISEFGLEDSFGPEYVFEQVVIAVKSSIKWLKNQGFQPDENGDDEDYNLWEMIDFVGSLKENTTENKSQLSESKKRLKELTQDEFNRLARRRDEFRTQTAISPAEKNDLYADIKDFEEEFRDLQDTAERLPDSYINQVCSTSSYPFDVAIDEVQDVEDWCSEAEEFLKDDINNWGIVKEANISKKRLKETFDSTSAAFNLTKLKGYLRFETKWEYDEDFIEDAMLVDKIHEPPRFTVKWIGPKGKKHPNTYCVRTRRDRGESWDWETHYFLKASDAAEMINLEVGTWEHNNESWRFN